MLKKIKVENKDKKVEEVKVKSSHVCCPHNSEDPNHNCCPHNIE